MTFVLSDFRCKLRHGWSTLHESDLLFLSLFFSLLKQNSSKPLREATTSTSFGLPTTLFLYPGCFALSLVRFTGHRFDRPGETADSIWYPNLARCVRSKGSWAFFSSNFHSLGAIWHMGCFSCILVTSNLRILIRRIKYEVIIKLITQIEANSQDESIKSN
jgi:hypothetical protein